ncbi:MAG TPA: bifunctional glutamate N-acetyltransferase/amino-acid acetyltransferase ArgJ [Solirubrobacteraceae bacterium]|nr:bifunctional glutamate N-acetyltransferase/amino-acid acetyltransferase ArgJ [Solirubrobacteraceae bacterium]
MSFFDSRWVPRPEHVAELAGALPRGFRASGVAAGIKPSGNRDLALLVCDAPEGASAARFTRSGVLAAPVLLTQERCRLGALRAVVANSGNANAATGRRGLEDAAKLQDGAAAAAGLPPEQVAVCSTGVIGVPLDADALVGALPAAERALADDGDHDFLMGIQTTDVVEKRAALEVALDGGTVRLSAQAKGAGMISPHFATLLCFVETDAALDGATCDLLLGATCARSFERISVDGQLSTNDTVVLLASGASGVRVEGQTDDELRLGEALDALLRQLALLCVRDGEGARRVGRVVVRGGHHMHVEAAARAVADSPLVKTALHGGDANWGRIAQAVGAALPGTAPLPLDIAIEGVPVLAGGGPVDYDAADLTARVAGAEVAYDVGLPGDGAETEVFFSDLGHDYVTLNAEYTT